MMKRLMLLEREYGKWANPAPPPGSSRSSKQPMSERRRTVIIVTSVALIVGGVLSTGYFNVWASSPQGNVTAHPGKPGGRLSAGDHAFLATQSDGKSPITYDPCKPIHVVVNDRMAIKNGSRLVDQAIGQVKKASGQSFIVDGTTDENPSRERPLHVDRYDSAYAPVLLAWSDPKRSPKLAGGIAGYAGSQPVADGNRWMYVTGSVILDGPQLDELLGQREGWADARAVVMHELGHLVGLDHVDASGELMQPKGQPGLVSWGTGDLAGFAVLGSGQCA